ncbi:alpha/beta fold hydrolase [Umezakia ovalisporum]|uniref:Alpha/beta hydrolase n=2 Tax=Umezakia ovalisporum TaxID=75695 RepID=A0AA43H092_9CYAN|nr:alpha/beta hydrolase [Umezakia ovalisporum]MDH6056894.1 alpha/beta hydrolase [Umezakia ovalisporum FSS-43]MDH6064368.1 alpha/beta hydrolase [Umezakia ovalisporum FSS-62]MDH6067982.1 alpha/beta hydrolase [Umezakia ovalisporum APH033B]MDH6070934.1 alpha/beta hydrolase [Umezakia ovalisporum CobakiLakeA]MDH6074690.1 alpha/beta hydrolase [Umezakia ovalisporum CS-1034]
MPKFKVNEIDLFYDIKGQGEPLLLISGFLCDHSYWSLIMPSLVSEYQVIRVDNRGMGRSSAPNSPYSLQDMAKDVAALLDHIGIDQVNVVGHSMGGQIAQELVLANPEKVKSLILLSTLAQGDGRFNHVIETWGDLPSSIDMRLYEKVVLPWVFTDEFYAIPNMVEELIEWAVNYPFAPDQKTLYYHSRAILASNTIDRLYNIHCPTLILVGRQDIITPVKFSQQLAEGIPHAELVVIDRGGHGFLIESSHQVISVILQFLRKLSSPIN